jgi:hypothetical protein
MNCMRETYQYLIIIIHSLSIGMVTCNVKDGRLLEVAPYKYTKYNRLWMRLSRI